MEFICSIFVIVCLSMMIGMVQSSLLLSYHLHEAENSKSNEHGENPPRLPTWWESDGIQYLSSNGESPPYTNGIPPPRMFTSFAISLSLSLFIPQKKT